ncbi:zf-HC2 domain-containing protein [Candidatus Omnitrophota bacterium]
MNCPNENTLLNYIQNSLSDKERVEIEHHLRFCDRCMNLLRIG